MYEYDTQENILNDFELFKNEQIETDLQKLIDCYIMSLYYDILDYLQDETDNAIENVCDYIENTIKSYYEGGE